MKFSLGRIPEDATFSPEEGGWTPMKEPSPWLAQLLAVPIGGATAVALLFLWASSVARPRLEADWRWVIGWAVAMVVLHEMIHAALHPRMGTSPHTTLGFWPSRLMFYAHYGHALSRNRFIAILLGPFVAISLVPLIVSIPAGSAPLGLALISVLNGLLSCADLLGVLLLLVQVPKNAAVRNKGWKTYYRTAGLSPGRDRRSDPKGGRDVLHGRTGRS